MTLDNVSVDCRIAWVIAHTRTRTPTPTRTFTYAVEFQLHFIIFALSHTIYDSVFLHNAPKHCTKLCSPFLIRLMTRGCRVFISRLHYPILLFLMP